MRTTLTLDDDVARLLEQVRRRRQGTFKDVVNDALRAGLVRLEEPANPPDDRRTASVSLGGSYLNNVDDVAEALAVAEGESFR